MGASLVEVPLLHGDGAGSDDGQREMTGKRSRLVAMAFVTKAGPVLPCPALSCPVLPFLSGALLVPRTFVKPELDERNVWFPRYPIRTLQVPGAGNGLYL